MRLLICTQAVDRYDPTLGFFLRWLEEFSKHCESVIVICLQKGEYELPKNVKVYSLGKERGRVSRFRYVLRFWKLLFLLRGRYDAVFVHMNPEYVVLGGLWWRLAGKKIGLWYTHKNVGFRLRVATFLSNHIFTASKESFRIPSKKVMVMGHGIDTTRAKPHVPRLGIVRLMTSGRLSPIKHVEVILSAFLRLKEKGVVAECVVLGGPISHTDMVYKDKLFALLTEGGEDPEKILVGAVPHERVSEYHTVADYFLHASETGSLDKAVLDAALSGLIPISSSEAYTDFFEAYSSLLQYPKGDSNVLAERIIALEKLSEEERKKIVLTLQVRVKERYSLTTLIPRILTLYRV